MTKKSEFTQNKWNIQNLKIDSFMINFQNKYKYTYEKHELRRLKQQTCPSYYFFVYLFIPLYSE